MNGAVSGGEGRSGAMQEASGLVGCRRAGQKKRSLGEMECGKAQTRRLKLISKGEELNRRELQWGEKKNIESRPEREERHIISRKAANEKISDSGKGELICLG